MSCVIHSNQESFDCTYCLKICDSPFSNEAQRLRDVCYVLQNIAKATKDANSPLDLCGVFIDTTFHVANCAATKEDPSARSAHLFKKTFHPFFFLPTVDIFKTSVLHLGRPLWGAYQISGNDTLIDFAKVKLMGGVGAWNNCDKESTAVALLSSRLSLRVSPLSQMTKKLVSTHMGTLVGISPDMNHIYVDYPSEPILAEAAAHLMRNSLIYKECLHTLQHLASLHVIEDVGEIGELVSRIILTRCFDVCVYKKSSSAGFAETRIKVKDFLKTLLGKAEIEFADVFQVLSDGEVAYTHFTRIKRFPTLADLKHAFDRRVAFQLWQNAKSIDIIIPIRLEDGTFRAIVIQVKNTRDTLHYRSLLKAAAVVAKEILKSDRTDRSVSNILPSKKRRAKFSNSSLDTSYEDKPMEDKGEDNNGKDLFEDIIPDEDVNDDTGLDPPDSTASGTTTPIFEGRAKVDPAQSHIVIVIAFQKMPSVTISKIMSRDSQAIGITILGEQSFKHLAPNDYGEWIADLEKLLRGTSIYVDLEEDEKKALQRVMGISELDTYEAPTLP